MIKLAIQKAIEGGWKDYVNFWQREDGSFALCKVKDVCYEDYSINDITNDPLFWQCLGKALGQSEFDKRCISSVRGKPKLWDIQAKSIISSPNHNTIYLWLYHWHRFIDWLAEEKDIEEFFKKLLK